MAFLDFIKRNFTGTGSDNTPEGSLIRTGGKHITKTITLNANNTSASVNVFTLTGTVNCIGLHGEVLTDVTFSNCTNVYFDLWDGTTSVPITKITTAALSGFGVGSFFIKDADVASALTTLQNNQARIKEVAIGGKANAPFLALAKSGATTYIRFNYTTTNAPINATLSIHLVWEDIDGGTVV